jgi:hypothetical protein
MSIHHESGDFMRKFRFMSLAALGSSLALAAWLAVPASAATKPGTAVHADPAASSAEVAAGSITSAAGTAMPGTAVSLYAWPTDATVHAMRVGQTLPTTLLATTTTSSTGSYTLSVPMAMLKAAPTESGMVNMEVSSAAGGFWFFPYQPGSPAPQKVNVQASSRLSCGKDRHGNPLGFTGFQLERHRPPAWTIVGQGYILKSPPTRGTSLSFKYTQGSSHSQGSSLGVGVSGAGSSVGYTSQGTHESTAASTTTYGSQPHGALFRTMFNTEQLRGLCVGLPGETVGHVRQHGQCPRRWHRDYVRKCFWEIQSSTHFASGSVVTGTPAPRTPAKYCGSFSGTRTWGLDRGTAVRWSAGFELGAALNIKGVNLKASFNSSAQTGYDNNDFMQFNLHDKHVWICGTNRNPDFAAQIVERAGKP